MLCAESPSGYLCSNGQVELTSVIFLKKIPRFLLKKLRLVLTLKMSMGKFFVKSVASLDTHFLTQIQLLMATVGIESVGHAWPDLPVDFKYIPSGVIEAAL